MKRIILICICVVLLCGLCVPVLGVDEISSYRTITVKSLVGWTDLHIYNVESQDLGRWPGTPMNKCADGYVITIKNTVKSFIISGRDRDGNDVQSGTINLADEDSLLGVNKGISATITLGYSSHWVEYEGPATNKLTNLFYDVGPQSEYRVTGNASWLGLWNPNNPQGIMKKVDPAGIYRKTFYDVKPGLYMLKVTKGGTWDQAYGGADGKEYVFEVTAKGRVTVELDLRNGEGTVGVYTEDPFPTQSIPSKVTPLTTWSVSAPLSETIALTVSGDVEASMNYFLPLLLFSVVVVVMYMVFLLESRNRYTGDVTFDGRLQKRAQLSRRDVIQAVRDNQPMPSQELDRSILEAIQNRKKSSESP